MNERIAELYEQALVIEDGGDYVSGELDPVKFAELIVREVFAKIEDERFEIYQPVKESVMKHFGVK